MAEPCCERHHGEGCADSEGWTCCPNCPFGHRFGPIEPAHRSVLARPSASITRYEVGLDERTQIITYHGVRVLPRVEPWPDRRGFSLWALIPQTGQLDTTHTIHVIGNGDVITPEKMEALNYLGSMTNALGDWHVFTTMERY